MTDKQIIKLNEITEMSQELGLYEDRPDWRITLQADHIKRLEEELKAKEQECEELKKRVDDLLHKPEIQDKILWKIDNESLLGSKDAYIYKLEKTLAEIKEIAEDFHKTGFVRTDCGATLINNNTCIKTLEQILQKVSEVE